MFLKPRPSRCKLVNHNGVIYIHYAATPHSARSSAIYLLPFGKVWLGSVCRVQHLETKQNAYFAEGGWKLRYYFNGGLIHWFTSYRVAKFGWVRWPEVCVCEFRQKEKHRIFRELVKIQSNFKPSQLNGNLNGLCLRNDTYMRTILTCAQKRTSSQLSLPHGTVN